MPRRLTNKFTHRITFQQLVEKRDELGQLIDTGGEAEWQDVKSVYAMVKTLQGREYFAAAATQSENTTRFVIRYTTGLNSHMRISYSNRIFDIVAPPINDDELFQTLTIITRERL